jgi:flagellar biosynthetic protein FliP
VSFASLVTLLSALAVTLGVVVLASKLARKLVLAPRAGRPGVIEVLGRTNLAPRQGVATIAVEGRVMVVSFGEGGVRHLADLGTQADIQPLDDVVPPAPPAPAPVRSKGRRVALRALLAVTMLALGLGAAPLSAQSAAAATPEATATAILSGLAAADDAPQVAVQVGEGQDGLRVSGTVGTVVFIGFLTMIPTLLLLTTSFTRILIVLHLLKQALGTQTAPPAHLLAAMALLLTGFVMAPTFDQVHQQAITPWMDGQMDEVQMIETAAGPMREFMLGATREQDLAAFIEMRDAPPPETVDEIPFVVLTSAFVTSELTHAFQIGFALFLPFVVIDLVVASVLMSMGMFLRPPAMISRPFKLLLYGLVDGWALVMGSLVQSF